MPVIDLRLSYRPVRVAFCLSEGDFAAFRSSIEFATSVAGGRFNPIVPVEAKFAQDLLRSFNPDWLIPMTNTSSVTKFIENHWSSSEWNSAPFIEGFHASNINQFLSVERQFEMIRNDYSENDLTFSEYPVVPAWEQDDPLSDIHLCIHGRYPAVSDFDGLQSKVEEICFAKPWHIRRDENICWHLKHRSPLDLTLKGLDIDLLAYSPRFNWPRPGVFIGSAAEFYDLVCYWNLLAAGGQVVFFDCNHRERCIAPAKSWMLSQRTRQGSQVDLRDQPRQWLGTSYDVERDFDFLGTPLISELVCPGACFSPEPATYFFGETSTVALVEDEPARASFSLPNKPWAAFGPSEEHVAVRIRSYAFGRSGLIRPPYVPELNNYFSRSLLGAGHLRSQPTSVDILVNAWNSHCQVVGLESRTFLAKLFEVALLRISPSKAGYVIKQLVVQMGGEQGCRVFKITGIRKFIYDQRLPRSFSFSKALQFIRSTWQEEFSNFHLPFQEYTRLSPQTAFSYMVERSVFLVGKELICSRCQINFWCSLDDLKTRLLCPWCTAEVNVPVQLKDRKMDYRCSGLFELASGGEGAIPVMLVMQQLDTIFHSNLIILEPGHEIISESDEDWRCESDIVAVIDRDHKGIDILIGECKNIGPITEDDAIKLGRVADRLRRPGISVYVMFAKTSAFTVDEMAICLALNNSHDPFVILWGIDELEPYSVYERNKEKLGAKRYAHSLQDMALNTLLLFK